MVTNTRTLAAAAALAATAAVGLAGAAHADPVLLNGTYGIVGGDEATFHWSVVSNCRVRGCTASVSSNRGWNSGGRYGADGVLSFTVTKPDGAICGDGSFAPAVITYRVNPATLAGEMSADSNFRCPGGIITRTPFQLVQLA